MKDKQMAARPVLRMSASVDLRAASLHDAKKLLERLQELMRDPSLLDRSLAFSFFYFFYYYYGAIEACQLLHLSLYYSVRHRLKEALKLVRLKVTWDRLDEQALGRSRK